MPRIFPRLRVTVAACSLAGFGCLLQETTASAFYPAPAVQSGTNERVRTWTDIFGQSITAEFAGVHSDNVLLKINGGQPQAFPRMGFVAGDRQWITEHENDPILNDSPPSNRMPPSTGSPGTPPGNRPGFPGNRPGHGFPGTPGFPGSGMPSKPQLPGDGGSSMSDRMPPAYGQPGGTQPGGTGTSHPDSMHGAESPAFGAPGMGGFGPGNTHPESNNPFPEIPEPSFQPPEFSPPVFEYIFKCDQCGTEFDSSSGVKQGDACPKCSSSSFRFGRRSARGIVALLALVGSGIGWFIKKLVSN